MSNPPPPSHPSAPVPLRVYVGGLVGATELELRAGFHEIGVELGAVQMVLNASTGASRGFAFVDVVHEGVIAPPMTDARILEILRDACIHGRSLEVHPVVHVERR